MVFLCSSDRLKLVCTGLSYYQSNQQDPNISKHGGEDDSEADDFEVHASDFVILAARNEDEVSHIEVTPTSAVKEFRFPLEQMRCRAHAMLLLVASDTSVTCRLDLCMRTSKPVPSSTSA